MIDRSKFEATGLPAHTAGALERYVIDRIPPGDFLRGMLENDLRRSVSHADTANREAFFKIFMFIYNELPAACWGDREKVTAWLGENK